jgi:MoaA/NifB/PqqE/SkfB family radical SAM enzyme
VNAAEGLSQSVRRGAVVVDSAERKLAGGRSLRGRILDTLPHRLIGVLLPFDHFYRALIVPINYLVHRERARRGLEAVVRHSAVEEVHLEATNICNAACKFCAQRVMQRPASVMTLEDFRRYVDQIAAAGIRIFDLTAIVGDPFTDKHFFERLEYLKSRSAKTISLATNAIAMSPARADRIASFSESFGGDLVIRVSFGGFDRETYREIFQVDRFDRVVGNIVHLLERKRELDSRNLCVELQVRCPLSKLRGPTYRLFRGYESRQLLTIRRRVNRSLSYGNWGGAIDPSDIESVGLRAAKKPKRFFGPCDLMFSRGVIVTLDGTVNACACRDVEVSLPIGNLNQEAFMDIICGEARYWLMADMMEGRIPRFCRSCSEYRSIFSPEAEFHQRFLKWRPGSPSPRLGGGRRNRGSAPCPR